MSRAQKQQKNKCVRSKVYIFEISPTDSAQFKIRIRAKTLEEAEHVLEGSSKLTGPYELYDVK